MNHCKYCAENDESRLILSSRFINDKVKQEWVCSNCLWRDEFAHEAKEDGNALQFEEEIFEEREPSNLRKRTYPSRER